MKFVLALVFIPKSKVADCLNLVKNVLMLASSPEFSVLSRSEYLGNPSP